MSKQPIEIELEILKNRVDALEANEKFMMANWLDWKKKYHEHGTEDYDCLGTDS